MLKCTYIEIPQVPVTYSVLLAKPFWMWGAEMGSNEHGVTIGNEAVFTKTPYEKKPGLIGMDFLRLALERCKTATAALELITDLLETYGQGGNCGFAHPLYYHNSFLICDFDEAWVLETSGREWAAEKVVDVRSISNAITIGEKWDKASKNLVQNAVDKGWCKKNETFNFAKCYSDTIYTTFSAARRRQACTSLGLTSEKGTITTRTMMDLLKSHVGDQNPGWSPDGGITGADVCNHAGWGPIRGSQTTGSMVSVLKQGEPPLHWVTGTAAPCTSIFKPVWIDAGVPGTGTAPTGTYDEMSLYWRHEALHREILRDYATRIKLIQPELTTFQDQLLHEISEHRLSPSARRKEISESAFRNASEQESIWLKSVKQVPEVRKNSLLYRKAWQKFNREAKMD